MVEGNAWDAQAQSAGFTVSGGTAHSNTVTPSPLPDAATVVARANERGVLVMAFAVRPVRAVTHLDVSRADIDLSVEIGARKR